MAASFEAKLHGFRRTMDGVVVSYVVNPHDVSPELAMASLGTRYMVAFAEIGDDEKPRETPAAIPAMKAEAPKKERKPFASLPLCQQAAIRSTDEKFWEWINVTSENAAADYIRQHCKVASRREINEDAPAGLRWAELERQFKAHLTDERYGDLAR